MNSQWIILGIISATILFSNLPSSSSTLWDLVIYLELEQSFIQVGDIPVIMGTVTDHASKPISNAEIKIRLEQSSIITNTDELGNFNGEFLEFDGLPGNYIVNVLATKDEKIGLASISFQVKGELSVTAYTEKILSTKEAAKYLQASAEDFKNDPLGLILYNYYQELLIQLLEEQLVQEKLNTQQQLIEEQRSFSIELTQQIIEERNPEAGIYSGFTYDQFVDNLDLSIKDIIVNQLNYTVTIFEEAQKARDQILADGGTSEDAWLAYYEKASMPRELMNSLTTYTEIKNSTAINNFVEEDNYSIIELNQNGTSNTINQSGNGFTLNVNGTNIEVGKAGGVIYLNVNGTIVELIISGTEITQSINSTQN